MSMRRRDLVKRASVGASAIEGWGLIAREPISTGEVIDESPVILSARVPAEWEGHAYILSDGQRALPCGDGIFANHSNHPNAAARPDMRRKLVRLVALRAIQPGEEVTFDYGEDFD